ncbi:MAG: TRAP transporter permease [Deltaproteobacteria bacterium]|nr:TRAP transporter permease [Deltaproteobacteria bacterium]
MAEQDSETQRRRTLGGATHCLLLLIASLYTIFQIYAITQPITAMALRSIHLAFALVLVFLLFPRTDKSNYEKVSYIDWILIIVTIATGAYIAIEARDLSLVRQGDYTNTDIVIGGIIVALVIEGSRRVFSWAIPVIAAVFIAYAFWGHVLPGAIGHPWLNYYRIVSNLSLFTEGIFGVPLGASATVVAAFVIFAAFLNVSGVGELFINLANTLFGGLRAGPAKVAVMASAFFGTFSGSAAANTASTGTFTIPLMKRYGFSPTYAGAVEAVASSGGQIMPPVMGASAFVIAEILGVSYTKVCLAALIPAILYFTAVFVAVDLNARKNGLMGQRLNMGNETTASILKKQGHLLIPIVVLIACLAFFRVTPQMSALYSIITTIVVSFLRKETRITPKKFLKALELGGIGMLEVAVVCATAGIIVGVFTVTGLGLTFSGALIKLSGGHLFLLLILTMIASLILGMGVPTVAAYLVLAILVAPAMIKMGVMPLAAHLFVMYFGIISAITPPVAIAAYVGAGIAGAQPTPVAFTAFRLGIAAFIIPYSFIYGHSLLMIGEPLQIGLTIITAILGIVFLAAASEGFLVGQLNIVERAVFFAAALLMIFPGIKTDGLGFFLGLGIFLISTLRSRRKKSPVL